MDSDDAGSFIVPYSEHSGLKTIQIATRLSDSISDSQVSVQYIEMPHVVRLIPDVVP